MNIPQADLQPHENSARAAQDGGSFSQWDKMAERGRALAAEVIRTNPEKRKLVESVYGVTYCRNRYPEAYKKS